MSLSQSQRYIHTKTRLEDSNEADDFEFYQAEHLRLEFSAKIKGRRVPMPEDGTCRMEAWIDGTPETLYISKVGTVDISTEKAIVELTPAESNLSTGDYLYTVKVFDEADTEMGIVAYGGFTALYSPNTDAVSYVGTSPAFSIDLAGTAETDTALRLAPDGAGGVEWAAGAGGSGGHTIQEEGTPLTQRTNLNFIGAAVTAADDAGNDATTVTVNCEDGADVTDTSSVTAAGALMDSEVDADIKTLTVPANTTISAFGATLVDDADAATARTTLGVDAAGTDNSTPQEIDLSPGMWPGPKGTGGGDDDCGLASEDDSTLTGGSYDLIGVGVDTANAAQQSKAMQIQFKVPPTWTAFKTTGCFEFELWAESNTSSNCKYDVYIYGISDIGASINTIYSGAGKTFTTANTPQQLSIDVADLTSSTLPEKILININLYTANDFATIFAGGVARGQ